MNVDLCKFEEHDPIVELFHDNNRFVKSVWRKLSENYVSHNRPSERINGRTTRSGRSKKILSYSLKVSLTI